jgi:cobyric acid synthase
MARWKAAIVKDDESAAAFDEIMSRLESVTTDLNIFEAIHAGKWLSAEEQLTDSLMLAKLWNKSSSKDDVLVPLLEAVKNFDDPDKILGTIRMIRNLGRTFDYPEFKAIEKSLRSKL